MGTLPEPRAARFWRDTPALFSRMRGAVCYLDATIFYYHLVGVPTLSDECSDLLKRIELGRVQGVTSSMALADLYARSATLTRSVLVVTFGFLRFVIRT